jgi:hypothetical protein
VFASGGDSTAVGKVALISPVLFVGTVMLVAAVSFVASWDKVILLIVSFVELGTAVSVALLEFVVLRNVSTAAEDCDKLELLVVPFLASGSSPAFVGSNAVVLLVIVTFPFAAAGCFGFCFFLFLPVFGSCCGVVSDDVFGSGMASSSYFLVAVCSVK